MKSPLKHNMFARPLSRGDRRAGDRRTVAEASTLRGPGDEAIDVTVGDLSVSGFNIECAVPLPVGAVIQLGLPGSGRFAARVVRRDRDKYGCEFVEYLSEAQIGDAFATDNVAQLFVAASDWHWAEPKLDKWPRAVRVSVAIGGAIALWAVIFWLFLR